MAGKREERKKARFHWLVTSWLIVASVIIVGVGGIILFMNGLYHKEMRKENARIPQMLESSKDAKWAYAFNGELQTESESQSESQLESDSQSESKLQTESTEEQSIVSTVIEKEETQTQTQADVSSKAESAHNVVIGDVKSEKPTYVSLVAVGDNLMHYDVSMSGLQADGALITITILLMSEILYRQLIWQSSIRSVSLAVISGESKIILALMSVLR